MTTKSPRKGVIARLFGIVLIFVGMLDSMLNWPAGLGISGFYMFLMAAGAMVYVIGAVRRGRNLQEGATR